MAKPQLGAFVAISTLALAAAAAADTLPADWSARADGALTHGPSGVVCPTEVAGFKRTGIDSKGAPDSASAPMPVSRIAKA